MTPPPTTIAARLAAHLPALPHPAQEPNGWLTYTIGPYVCLTVAPHHSGYRAILTGADCLRLARPEVEAVTDAPEVAVDAAIHNGDHILATAALTAAQQAHALAVLLGTSLPTKLPEARDRVDRVRRVWSALLSAAEVAEGACLAAKVAKANAGLLTTVEAALPGLTGPAHADRVAILRTLAGSGWHKINANRIRWLQGAGLVDAHKVITAYDRSGRPTASFTQASITDAGRATLRALTPTPEPTP